MSWMILLMAMLSNDSSIFFIVFLVLIFLVIIYLNVHIDGQGGGVLSRRCKHCRCSSYIYK